MELREPQLVCGPTKRELKVLSNTKPWLKDEEDIGWEYGSGGGEVNGCGCGCGCGCGSADGGKEGKGEGKGKRGTEVKFARFVWFSR